MDKIPELKPVTSRCVKLDPEAWDGPPTEQDPQWQHAEYVRWQMVKAAQDVLAHCPLTTKERAAAEKVIELFDWVAPVGIGDDIAPF